MSKVKSLPDRIHSHIAKDFNPDWAERASVLMQEAAEALTPRTGPPPRDKDSYYQSDYSVPVWIQVKKGRGACVRWSFIYEGWVDYNWRDGTAPEDNDYLVKIPKDAPWILLPFHVPGTKS